MTVGPPVLNTLGAYRVSVVVPTRNRPDLLSSCLSAVAASGEGSTVELIVVDDGSTVPVAPQSLPPNIATTLLRLEGVGPAAARNAGLAAARGDIVLFTDDDTVPFAAWIPAAVMYLDSHPEAVGVTGPIRSVAWDPLYEQSIEADAAGHQWTCNIGYRRSVLVALRGFRAEAFTYAHAEDRDLAIRAMDVGAIGFADAMEVAHTPRRMSLRTVVRQARWASDDLTLYALHPHLTNDFTLPVRLALVVGAGRRWLSAATHQRSERSATRLLRGAGLGIVASVATAWTVLRTPSARVLRSKHATPTT
jgi:glycosyltransferase involved in cell wall biosynthesis